MWNIKGYYGNPQKKFLFCRLFFHQNRINDDNVKNVINGYTVKSFSLITVQQFPPVFKTLKSEPDERFQY